ncbi:MAG: polyprenyl synthetase family protein [Candidatus Absconditabacteria bacterium]
MDIGHFKKQLDKSLSLYLYGKIKELNSYSSDDNIKLMIEYLYDIVLSGGKRIRPYLVFLSYKSFGGTNNDILEFSSGFELFHNFALIHDDVIDKGTKRHGILTANEKFKKLIKHNDKIHLSNSQAILVGDLLYNRSLEVINKKYSFDESNLLKSRQYFFKMIDEVILGQMIDVNIMGLKKVDKESIRLKNYLKTASYTFIKPLQIGAIMAGNNSNMNLLEKVGENMGLAFQIRDDLSDIVKKSSDKTQFSDIQDGQHTYITDYIYSNGTKEQIKILNQYMGKKMTPKDIKIVQKMIDGTQAVNHCLYMMNDLCNQATNYLEKINFTKKEYKNNYIDLINLLRRV